MRVRRRLGAIAVVAAGIATLTGCTGVTPYGVANHEAKMGYHATAAEEVLGVSVFEGIAATPAFSSVGYSHAETGENETLHVRVETSVWDTTYLSQRAGDVENGTVDTVHIGGSGTDYFLFGDLFLPVTKTPWVSFPGRDLTRSQDDLCQLGSVEFLCGISAAWTLTRDAHGEDVPIQIETNADGSRHVTSVVTFTALNEAGIFTISDDLRSRLGEDVMEAYIPLHVWLDADGVLTKIEANGEVEANGEQLQVQFGFEMTGTPTEDEKPADPSKLDQQFVTPMSEEQAPAFWTEINKIANGG